MKKPLTIETIRRARDFIRGVLTPPEDRILFSIYESEEMDGVYLILDSDKNVIAAGSKESCESWLGVES